MKLGAFLLTLCESERAERYPLPLTVSRRSVTQREKATDIFSPFLVVCNKTGL